ncbi:MAG: signal peptidase I [Candidatus Saccharimonadia bacterium]
MDTNETKNSNDITPVGPSQSGPVIPTDFTPILNPSAPPNEVPHAQNVPTPVSPAESNQDSPSFGSRLSGVFFALLNWIVIPLIIVFILHNFVFQAFHVVGSSMNPTLHDADYIIVSKLGKTISSAEHKDYIPTRYDIVVFHYPKDPSLIFVKRVIGLPGEHVVVKNGQVTVYNAANPNGLNPDVETYQRAANTTLGNFDDTVPQGDIFVLGDNRTPNGSFDSRDWGFLPSSYIIGNAVVRLLPLDQFRLFAEAEMPILYITHFI